MRAHQVKALYACGVGKDVPLRSVRPINRLPTFVSPMSGCEIGLLKTQILVCVSGVCNRAHGDSICCYKTNLEVHLAKRIHVELDQ